MGQIDENLVLGGPPAEPWVPVQTLALALALGVAGGTAALLLPGMAPPGPRLTWLEAFFTATSAVCGAGLSVRGPAGFTPLGQAVIALLVQAGGLVVLVFAAVVVYPVLRRGCGDGELEPALARPARDWARGWRCVGAALVIEVVGAVLLMILWPAPAADALGVEAMTPDARAGASLFAAINAFCNAGFGLDSEAPEWRYALATHLVLAPLIVAGGLGLPVLGELWRAVRGGGRAALSRYSRIVLVTGAAVYLVGFVAIMGAQLKPYANRALKQGMEFEAKGPPALDKPRLGALAAEASLQALTAGTGGTGATPPEQLEPAGQFTVLALTFIGGAPTGAGGGVRTLTLAVLVAALVAALRRRGAARLAGATLSPALVRAAGAVAGSMLALIALTTFLLALSEPYPLGKLAFEATSAVSGGGLSLGITGDLTAFGRWVLVAAMFAGRVLPLGLLAVVADERAATPGARAATTEGSEATEKTQGKRRGTSHR